MRVFLQLRNVARSLLLVFIHYVYDAFASIGKFLKTWTQGRNQTPFQMMNNNKLVILHNFILTFVYKHQPTCIHINDELIYFRCYHIIAIFIIQYTSIYWQNIRLNETTLLKLKRLNQRRSGKQIKG